VRPAPGVRARGHAARVAAVLLRLLNAAEVAADSVPGLLAVGAACDQIIDLLLEVMCSQRSKSTKGLQGKRQKAKAKGKRQKAKGKRQKGRRSPFCLLRFSLFIV
jgi:hypothetical protein